MTVRFSSVFVDADYDADYAADYTQTRRRLDAD